MNSEVIRISTKLDFSSLFKSTLNKYIESGKDQLDVLSHKGMVYKIFCEDCEASYMDQTKRKLKIRVQEHKLDINKNTGSPTVTSRTIALIATTILIGAM